MTWTTLQVRIRTCKSIARSADQFIEHVEQRLAGAFDFAHELAMLQGQTVIEFENLRETQHRGHRRTQLVTELREEQAALVCTVFAGLGERLLQAQTQQQLCGERRQRRQQTCGRWGERLARLPIFKRQHTEFDIVLA